MRAGGALVDASGRGPRRARAWRRRLRPGWELHRRGVQSPSARRHSCTEVRTGQRSEGLRITGRLPLRLSPALHPASDEVESDAPSSEPHEVAGTDVNMSGMENAFVVQKTTLLFLCSRLVRGAKKKKTPRATCGATGERFGRRYFCMGSFLDKRAPLVSGLELRQAAHCATRRCPELPWKQGRWSQVPTRFPRARATETRHEMCSTAPQTTRGIHNCVKVLCSLQEVVPKARQGCLL